MNICKEVKFQKSSQYNYPIPNYRNATTIFQERTHIYLNITYSQFVDNNVLTIC